MSSPINCHSRQPSHAQGSIASSPAQSNFAAQDPFYAAAEASSRLTSIVQPQQLSPFAQNVFIAQHSPFYTQETSSIQKGMQDSRPNALSIDTRGRYFAMES